MNKQETEESEPENVVTIANRGIEVYWYSIGKKFLYNDQVELRCVSRYLPITNEIISMLSAFGIYPDNKERKIVFVTTDDDIINKKTGESYCQPVHHIVLTKDPELYRFTKIK